MIFSATSNVIVSGLTFFGILKLFLFILLISFIIAKILKVAFKKFNLYEYNHL